MSKEIFFRGVAPFLFIVAVTVLSSRPAGADEFSQGAGRFISGLADEAIAALGEKNTPLAEKEKRFRSLLNKNFAVKAIARWVLGRHWRKATKAERKEYLALFEDLLVVTYTDRFSRYSGETLEILRTLGNGGKDAVVYSRIVKPAGDEPLAVDWRVRKREGRYRVVDVIVAGISMGQTQRSEFASVIRRNGGGMEGLLAEIRKRVNRGS
ncbi:MAG TPA: ABC transporter substrate-binding protein [Rhodospirillales bacterium]|nr:ABC transporter substrate-binding protein [Rhodospirillales bacterium]